jgi:hypothetical protein
MLERGKFIVIKGNDPEMDELNEEVVHYINDDFPLADVQALYDIGYLDLREPTLQEKKICYLAIEYMDKSNGIFVKEIDKLEKFFKDNSTT